MIEPLLRAGMCALLLLSAPMPVRAQNLDEPTEQSCWQYVSPNKYSLPRHMLCFDGEGRVENTVDLVGQHGTESYQVSGRYSGTRGRIRLEIELTEYGRLGWPWEFAAVTCDLIESERALSLSNCDGRRAIMRADGSIPPAPTDMIFNRQ